MKPRYALTAALALGNGRGRWGKSQHFIVEIYGRMGTNVIVSSHKRGAFDQSNESQHGIGMTPYSEFEASTTAGYLSHSLCLLRLQSFAGIRTVDNINLDLGSTASPIIVRLKNFRVGTKLQSSWIYQSAA